MEDVKKQAERMRMTGRGGIGGAERGGEEKERGGEAGRGVR